MAGHSRVQPSTMVNIRITFPVLTQSLKKSIDQRSFGRLAAGLVTGPRQRIRRRTRIRMANPSSRYSRYTRFVIGGHALLHQHRGQSSIPKPHGCVGIIAAVWPPRSQRPN